MTAMAISISNGVQLSPEHVTDSRLGVLPGAMLSGEDLRRASKHINGDGRSFKSQHSAEEPPSTPWNPALQLPPSNGGGIEVVGSSALESSRSLSPSGGARRPSSSTSGHSSADHYAPVPPRSSSITSDLSGRGHHLAPTPTPPPQQHHHSAAANGKGSPPSPSQRLFPSTINGTYDQPPQPAFVTGRLSTASASSAATSNSSHLPPTINNGGPSPRLPLPPSAISLTPSTATSELDPTAALIQKLYARLEAQGVPGDGWDEGRERSRDGIINRVDVESSPIKGKGPKVEFGTEDAKKKEETVLRRVDRYGFFSQSHPAALACQHNRLATLSETAFLSLPGSRQRTKSRTPVSPSLPPTNPNRISTASVLTTLDPAAIALETKRIDKWSEMLRVGARDQGGNAKEWDVESGWWDGRGKGGGGKYRKLQRRVFKGVPDRWRRAVWGLELERMAKESAEGNVKSLVQLEREYKEYLALPSAQDIQIDLDVPRTISGHVLFHTRYGQGQRALFHVLHAFGLHCDDIGGYCQGMGPIAATLLCYFEPERAYAGLVRLFDQYQLRHIFAPGFPGLVETFYVQEKLVELLMPDVHKAFAEHFISTSSYATKWYITLFANSVPFGTQLRFWDGLLLEGLDFLVITAVAIIWCFKKQFTSPSASFESILSILSSYFFVESDDALLRWIRKTLRMKDLRRKIRGWREEWKGFVLDGSADRRVS